MSKNPFTIIFGIEPDSMIPRNAEYNQVISDFMSSSPVSYAYVITGVRGCGKTVLMTSIQKFFSKQGDWITLRLNPDLDLYESSISQLSEHISIKSEIITEASVSFAGIGGGVARRSLSDNETLLKKMLIEAKKKKKRVLITIDEVSNTANIKTFFHSYQSFIGERLPVFLLITALPENFSALSNAKNSTFIRRLPKIRLRRLSDVLVEDKYMEIFSLNQDEALVLTKLIKGYPYAFQLLGTLLWDSHKKEVDDSILRELDTMLYDGSYKAIWDHLTENERRVVLAIAHSEDSTIKSIRQELGMESNQFSPYRENLKDNGLIDTNTYGKIYFTLPRFKEFTNRIERYMI